MLLTERSSEGISSLTPDPELEGKLAVAELELRGVKLGEEELALTEPTGFVERD